MNTTDTMRFSPMPPNNWKRLLWIPIAILLIGALGWGYTQYQAIQATKVVEEAYQLSSQTMGQRLINVTRQSGEAGRLDIEFTFSQVGNGCQFDGGLKDGHGSVQHQFSFSSGVPCTDLDMDGFLELLEKNIPENMKWVIGRLRDMNPISFWWMLFKALAMA